MNARKLILFILFYILPLILVGIGLYIGNIVPVLVGLIWIISAFVLREVVSGESFVSQA
jgi:hypothetical protein